jgi:hypothetical protein
MGKVIRVCWLSIFLALFPACGRKIMEISLDRESVSMPFGCTLQLAATVAPESAGDPSISWTSSDASIVSVSETGLLTAGKAGTATVTATAADGGRSDACEISVAPLFAGYHRDGSLARPCYWEGAKLHELSGNQLDKEYAYSPAAWSEGTAYLAGYFHGGPIGMNLPCFWKGDTLCSLAGKIQGNGYASSIVIANGSPFISGYYEKSGVDVACYWEGTTLHDLVGADPARRARAYAIAVSKGTVYAAGFFYDGTKEIPCYWEGDALHTLTGPFSERAIACSIAVSGGTVYAAGFYAESDDRLPCYWDGEGFHSLAGAWNGSGDAYAITVSEGKAFIAGLYVNDGITVPCYWEGTTRHDLESGFSDAKAATIVLGGGIPYSAGIYFDGSSTYACYWEGTAFHTLKDDASRQSFIANGFMRNYLYIGP